MKEISDIKTYIISVFPSRQEMGLAAGKAIEAKIVDLLKRQYEVRMIFAAAPSQNEVLDYLVSSSRIDWAKVVAFHMDEYIGGSAGSSSAFSYYLKNRIFDKVNFKQVHLIHGNNPAQEEIERYTHLLERAPIDIVCLGIGENGHIAFNDPPEADFYDPKLVKTVFLDEECRQQQVNDGCFSSLAQVPQEAITLTIPALMCAKHVFCVVPEARKKEAVRRTLYGPIDTSCPASILRSHPSCQFYFDENSYSEERSEVQD